MKRILFAFAAFVALAIAGYVWVDTQWIGGWGTPGWVEDARKEMLATPLFNDPPPEWTVDARTASTGFGDREHITAYWTAPGTVAEAVKALHTRHGGEYTIRRANDPKTAGIRPRGMDATGVSTINNRVLQDDYNAEQGQHHSEDRRSPRSPAQPVTPTV